MVVWLATGHIIMCKGFLSLALRLKEAQLRDQRSRLSRSSAAAGPIDYLLQQRPA